MDRPIHFLAAACLAVALLLLIASARPGDAQGPKATAVRPTGNDSPSTTPATALSLSDGGIVRRDGYPDYFRAYDEKLMDRAVEKARQTQTQFVAALANPPARARAFGIKKGFAVKGGRDEHIWLVHVRWDGKQYSGVISNEPVDTDQVKLGERVTVLPEELSDWMYIDGDQLVGGYTTRVLYQQASPEDRRAIDDDGHTKIPPVDF